MRSQMDDEIELLATQNCAIKCYGGKARGEHVRVGNPKILRACPSSRAQFFVETTLGYIDMFIIFLLYFFCCF